MSGREFFAPDRISAILYCFMLGALFGAFYDILRLKRSIFGKHRIILFADDFIFCVVSALSLVVVAYNKNSGVIRWYMPVSAFSGFLLYRRTIGKLIYDIMQKIVSAVKKIIFSSFILPLTRLVNKINNKSYSLLCKTKKFIKKLKKHFSFLKYRCKILREISNGIFGKICKGGA